MELLASTTRARGADPLEEARALAKTYTSHKDAVLCIMPKKKARGTLVVCLGRFTAEDGGRIVWMPHAKQAFLGHAETTDNSFEELGADGPTIPILLTALGSEVRRWVEDNATRLDDWCPVDTDHGCHDALRAHYHGGGSLDVFTKALADAAKKQEKKKKNKGKPPAAAEAKPAASIPELVATEPRRGRSMARSAKRVPSSSPAQAKQATKKPASPQQKEGKTEPPPAELATPPPAERRSSRLASKAAETPTAGMKKLSL